MLRLWRISQPGLRNAQIVSELQPLGLRLPPTCKPPAMLGPQASGTCRSAPARTNELLVLPGARHGLAPELDRAPCSSTTGDLGLAEHELVRGLARRRAQTGPDPTTFRCPMSASAPSDRSIRPLERAPAAGRGANALRPAPRRVCSRFRRLPRADRDREFCSTGHTALWVALDERHAVLARARAPARDPADDDWTEHARAGVDRHRSLPS